MKFVQLPGGTYDFPKLLEELLLSFMYAYQRSFPFCEKYSKFTAHAIAWENFLFLLRGAMNFRESFQVLERISNASNPFKLT